MENLPSRKSVRAKRQPSFEKLEDRQMMSVTLMTSSTPAAAPAGSAKLTGTTIGTAGSFNNAGNTISKATDGNLSTYFDAPSYNGGWVGLDLGVAEQITQVQYAPRAGWGGRMTGGFFQGSNTVDFSSGNATLFTVPSAPTSGVYTSAPVTVAGAFRYVRYVSPNSAYGNVAEVEFDGASLTPVAPVAPVVVAAAPTALTATSSAAGVHLTWMGDPASTIDSYTVKRQGPTDSTYVTLTTVTGTSYDDVTALASTAYSYVVVANNSAGLSPSSTAVAVTMPTPAANPWIDADLGSPGKAGSASVSPTGTVTVNGGGADIWGMTDQFNYQYQSLVGNGTVVAQVTSQTNVNGWAKSGVMIRETTNTDSRFVLLALTPGNGISLQARSATHSTPGIVTGTVGTAGVWLKLARVGNVFTGSYSSDGVTWKVLGSVTVNMVNNVTAGLAVSAHDNTKLCTTTFANVSTSSGITAASAWSNAATTPLSRWEAQNFTYNGKLYAFGGFVSRTMDATSESDVYDPATQAWSTLAPIPVVGGLTHSAVTVVGDTAYFAGGDIGTFSRGKTSITATATVLTYNMTTNTWGTVTSLPAAGSCAGLVGLNNKLYYFGGLNATCTVDQSATLVLDLANPSAGWVARAALPNARNHLGAVTINGLIYAVGGNHLYNLQSGNDAEVDVYNPTTDTWARVANLPVPNSSIGVSTLVANGKIVVVGGQTNGGYAGIYQSAVVAYDPSTNKWTQVATLPEASQSASVAYINGQLIVANGTVDNQGGWAQNWTWVNSSIVI